MCLNKKVLIGLGIVAIGLLLLKPAWMVVALPLLILAICPLSMILMMRGKGKTGSQGSSCSTGAGAQKTSASTPSETDRQISALQAELRSLKAAQAAQAEQSGQESGPTAERPRTKKHL
ncbi:DUF2933 domain-containing protein [Streptomyces halobius]|uniref:DUF2933 domain-containing protein n=1 Tax=Streptomyces halobius TaxID=2879846 RepID=A0ABY4LZZ4_9ACTN|nr:DUF2933 domain-containing protein [Streptomyces halobius]UQA91071.1 DUF2933 domain-containing protein [Streptomyces halobius]